MSKRIYPVSDAQMRRDANNNRGYSDRVERMEVALKARYGEAYKRWPEDYLKATAPNAELTERRVEADQNNPGA